MGVDNPKTIVDLLEECESLPDGVHRQPRDRSRNESHDDGTPASDHTSCGSDRDKSRNHTVDSANDGRFLVDDDIEEGPPSTRHGRADVSVENGGAGIGTRSVRITTVEAVPSDPQNACTGQDHEKVVRAEIESVLVQTWPYPVCADETGSS